MLPPLPTLVEIRHRLPLIFTDGTLNREKVVTPTTARTIFVALYIGAIEGGERVLQPMPVYRMTEEQAALTDDDARRAYTGRNRSRGQAAGTNRWYEDNSREGIRDDSIREGLVPLGAAVVKPGVSVNANEPRYVLTLAFSKLFDPDLNGASLEEAIQAWRTAALNPGALARIALARQGALAGEDYELIRFPNGETRRMRPGPSTAITKAVIEVFATYFLVEPTIIATSDTGNKVYLLDDARARAIGLNIKADQDLPDIILVDFGVPTPLLVFVEVVASDGPVSQRRKEALHALVEEAGFPAEHVALVTAYRDRGAQPFRKTASSLAWGSYAWFVSEPEKLIVLSEKTTRLTGRP